MKGSVFCVFAAFDTDEMSYHIPILRPQAVIWQFLEMDPNNAATWYPPRRKSTLVFLHQHQTLWDNRQSPRLYQAVAPALSGVRRSAGNREVMGFNGSCCHEAAA